MPDNGPIQPSLFEEDTETSPQRRAASTTDQQRNVTQHPALRTGLITYIGNKRSLIPFISGGMDRIREHIGPIQTMADPFTGSGVVSRLGRLRGTAVVAGDIEDYARPFGRAYLEVTPEDIDAQFGSVGGYDAVLSHLNSLDPARQPGRPFFSRHYAPRSTDNADPDRERMFYTRENALKIDAILTQIHEQLPLSEVEKDILLASVLVEMSVHNNTSGVMKGFHHGWGGRGGDALSRIMAPIYLERPLFLTGPVGRALTGPAEETLSEGAAWVRSQTPRRPHAFDLVYADPPYNIHQYGANYHLLTSAVRWDDYDPGPVVRGGRAGIRRDHYRSDFCKQRGETAQHAFARFLDASDTQALLLSYNDEGILSPSEIFDMLGEDGINTVELLDTEYTKFRGGKATQGGLRTREHLFVVLRGRRQSRPDRDRVRNTVEEIGLSRSARNGFIIPSKWESAGGLVETDNAIPGWRCKAPSGEYIEIDQELRVQRFSMKSQRGARDSFGEEPVDRIPADPDLRMLVSQGTGSVVDAVQELVAMEHYREAVDLLGRLKIKKFRSQFTLIATDLAGRDLEERTRRQLTELYQRVTGGTLPADRLP